MQTSDILTLLGIVVALSAYVSAARLFLHEQLKKPHGIGNCTFGCASKQECQYPASCEQNKWEEYHQRRRKIAMLSVLDLPLLVSGWGFLIELLCRHCDTICGGSGWLAVGVVFFVVAAVAMSGFHLYAFCRSIDTLIELRKSIQNSTGRDT